jgi:hypothetical protein
MLTSDKVWTILFTLLFFVFLGSTIAIIVQAVKNADEYLPKDIDVVLVERGRQMSDSQVRAVYRNMPFVKRIYVLRDGPSERRDEMNCTFVPFPAPNSSLEAAFLAVTEISGIHSHALFLGDYTWPLVTMSKTYLFAGPRPRMFNFLRDYAEQIYFADFLNPTVPSMVFEVQNLRDARSQNNHNPDSTIRSLMMQEVGESRLMTRNDMNRDIFLNMSYTDTVAKQIKALSDHTPLFATIHVSGADPNQSLASWKTNFLDKYFL